MCHDFPRNPCSSRCFPSGIKFHLQPVLNFIYNQINPWILDGIFFPSKAFWIFALMEPSRLEKTPLNPEPNIRGERKDKIPGLSAVSEGFLLVSKWNYCTFGVGIGTVQKPWRKFHQIQSGPRVGPAQSKTRDKPCL